MLEVEKVDPLESRNMRTVTGLVVKSQELQLEDAFVLNLNELQKRNM